MRAAAPTRDTAAMSTIQTQASIPQAPGRGARTTRRRGRLLAAAGLVVWIIYVGADQDGLAWTSFAILVAVALLGFTLFARWLPVHRATTPETAGATAPPERHLPLPVVVAHGLLGATTLVLVLLAALEVGGS